MPDPSLTQLFGGVAVALMAEPRRKAPPRSEFDLAQAQERLRKFWRLMLVTSALRAVALTLTFDGGTSALVKFFAANFAIEFLVLLGLRS